MITRLDSLSGQLAFVFLSSKRPHCAGIGVTFASAAHTAHEAGWLNGMQEQVADLSSFIRPGSVQSALATGMLGIQPRPVVAETVAWFLAAIPLLLFVLWPVSGGGRRRSTTAAASATTSSASSATSVARPLPS